MLIQQVTEIVPSVRECRIDTRGSGLMIRGFIVWDFSTRYEDFIRDVSGWVREGRIKYREDVVEGLENAPRALIGLLRGENFGKLLVRVAR